MKHSVTTSASRARPRHGPGLVASYLVLLAVAGLSFLISDIVAVKKAGKATSSATSGSPVGLPAAPDAPETGTSAPPGAPLRRIRFLPAPRYFVPPAPAQSGEDDAGSAPPADVREPTGGETVARSRSREPALFDQLRNHRSQPIPEEVRALAADITKNCTNNASRARAIYDWLTANITYDTAEWRNIVSGADDYIHPHDPASVLARGSTVCIGYAWLFDDLCASAGLESTFLIGDVRGYRGTPDEELVSSVRHAWSAVRDDEGGWLLLDATWGARQEGETEADYRARADYYYATPPNQFVFDHLPEDEAWQLLETPVPSETAFSVLPNLKPAFFTDGLKLGGDYTSVLGAQAGERHRLAFGKPAGTDVVFTLGPASNAGASQQIRAVTSAGGKSVAALLPALPRGEYLLRLYSRTDEGPYTCGADFVIRAQ